MRDALTFVVDAVLLWLNGFQAFEKMWPYVAPERREEIAKICEAHKGEKDYAIAHTAESQARIVHLLELVQRAQSSTEDAYQDVLADERDLVVGLDDLDRIMKRYVTYPTLVLHPRRRVFAIVQNPALSVWNSLVELTREERLETDPLKRRLYSVGPGCTPPAPTADESAVMNELFRSQVMPAPGSPERAILDAYNDRVDLACTHKSVLPETPHEEIAAAHAIMDLARLGAIHRVKRCDICKIWFFAKSKTTLCGSTPAVCRRERDKLTDGYKETQAAKAQRKKDKKEVEKLIAERERIRRAAKGNLTEDECLRVDAIKLSVAELRRGIEASERRAEQNKARGRTERRIAARPGGLARSSGDVLMVRS